MTRAVTPAGARRVVPAASRLPGCGEFEPEVVAWWRAHACERLGVAVSGGLDSMVLLQALHALPELKGRLVVLHFDHALRGRESALDAAHVEAVSRALGLPCVVGRWAEAQRPPVPDEATARGARLDFFARSARVERLGAILLAHHADDVAETLLQRLARGGGVEGLSAPRPVQPFPSRRLTLLRPLLGLSRARLRSCAKAGGLRWREDRSNQSRRHERNRLRLDALPALDRACGRDFAQGAAQVRRRLAAEFEALDWAAFELVRTIQAASCGEGIFLPGVLDGVPRALQLRAVQTWLQTQLGDASVAAAKAEPVLEAALAPFGSVLRLTPSHVLVVHRGRSRLEEDAEHSGPVWPGQRVRLGGALAGEDGALLQTVLVPLATSEQLRSKLALSDASRVVLVDAQVAGAELEVRCWSPGDRYRSLGAGGAAKLQDHFQNRRIPVFLRHRLPVVCCARGSILWVPGLPPAHEARLTEHSRTALQLTYRSPLAP